MINKGITIEEIKREVLKALNRNDVHVRFLHGEIIGVIYVKDNSTYTIKFKEDGSEYGHIQVISVSVRKYNDDKDEELFKNIYLSFSTN